MFFVLLYKFFPSIHLLFSKNKKEVIYVEGPKNNNIIKKLIFLLKDAASESSGLSAGVSLNVLT